MQNVLYSVTAALQREQERQLALGTGRIEQMFATDGIRQSSTSAGNIGHSETGLVEAVITALEREQKGQLARGTDRREHVFHDQLMGGNLQRGTATARIR